MNDHLLRFISAHCVRVPSGHFELKEFTRQFYEFLPPAARGSWRRGRVIAELSKDFPVAKMHGIEVVGGLLPRGQLREVNGELELTRAV